MSGPDGEGNTVESSSENALTEYMQQTEPAGPPAVKADLTLPETTERRVMPEDQDFEVIALNERDTWNADLTDAPHDKLD